MEQEKTLSLSNSMIITILGLTSALFALAFYRLTEQRVFDISNIVIDRQKGFCRVSLIAANRKPNRASGKILIQIYEDDGRNSSDWPNIYLAATSSVPISLASKQAKTVKLDIATLEDVSVLRSHPSALRANEPFEWTGPDQRSGWPPQTPCFATPSSLPATQGQRLTMPMHCRFTSPQGNHCLSACDSHM